MLFYFLEFWKKKQDMKLNKVTSRSIRKQYKQIKASSNTLFFTLMLMLGETQLRSVTASLPDPTTTYDRTGDNERTCEIWKLTEHQLFLENKKMRLC